MKVSLEQQYKEARLIAELQHRNQTYDDIFPYIKHIDDVVAVLLRFGYGGFYIIAGYLHDAVEDGSLTYNKIKKIFGEEVAELVLSVTNPSDLRNRKEKFAVIYKKLNAYPKGIILKLGDRIANVEHGLRFESEQSLMYKKEYPEFRQKLFDISPNDTASMWIHLDKLMEYKPLVTA